jgi:hypothetical protein
MITVVDWPTSTAPVLEWRSTISRPLICTIVCSPASEASAACTVVSPPHCPRLGFDGVTKFQARSELLENNSDFQDAHIRMNVHTTHVVRGLVPCPLSLRGTALEVESQIDTLSDVRRTVGH